MTETSSNQPIPHSLDLGETRAAWWEWRPELVGEKPTLFFAHATGFHSRVWDAVIEHFADHHVISLDMRGHGRSTGGPIKHWQVLADDLNAVASHCGIEQAIGVGHSMGAHSMAQAAADRPQGFARLVLFDPVIVDPAWYVAGDNLMFDPDTPHPTIKRKANFASAEAMYERFKDREPYSLFQPRVLRDYCEHGVTPLEGGPNKDGVGEDGVGEDGDTVTLACPPEVEASVYMSSRSNVGIHDAAKTVDVPVTVVRAMQTNMMDFKGSPTWKELASVFPKGTDMDRGDMTHFHPFQDPADAARIIAEE